MVKQAPTGDPVADDTLDAAILAAADAEWCHVALLIARATDACRAAGLAATGQQIAARIYVLAEAGKLEVEGNVRRWRAGKVRAATTV